jgi:predicted deacylase
MNVEGSVEEHTGPRRIDRFVSVADPSEGTSTVVPVTTLEGQSSGKRLWIQGGVHGDEYTGVGAITKLQDTIDPKELTGQLTLVPVMHVAAINAMQRFSPIDGMDLANSYPGRPDGFVTERIADWMISQMKTQADVVIDLHTSEAWGDAYAYVNAALSTAKTAEASLNLAKVFGFPWIIQASRVPEKMLLRPELDSLGKVAISIELGGLGIWTEKNISWLVEGLTNVMKFLGMLKGAPLPPRYPQRVLAQSMWIHTNFGGLMFTNRTAGEILHRGDTVATVRDFFGKIKDVIKMPVEGVILIQRLRPILRSGDEVALIGRLE